MKTQVRRGEEGEGRKGRRRKRTHCQHCRSAPGSLCVRVRGRICMIFKPRAPSPAVYSLGFTLWTCQTGHPAVTHALCSYITSLHWGITLCSLIFPIETALLVTMTSDFSVKDVEDARWNWTSQLESINNAVILTLIQSWSFYVDLLERIRFSCHL